MASLVAPRGNLWLQKDAADALCKVHFPLLDVGTFLHELVRRIRSENEIVNRVYP